ncbi:condensation domain-containing protein [Streptomyces sp. NPDC051207]|uniref:condensation domain-containing protein n=1 Tax=Streptomyces sp. NPDC051207 TaxID=3154641 RepID=UPI0034401EE4
MTVPPSSREAIRVVVGPGTGPDATLWTFEVHGPLDSAALEDVLAGVAAEAPGPARWRHHLVRHTPDHHTLRFTAAGGVPDASVLGRIADLLTEPPVGDRPLTPAQYAVLAQGGGDRYEAMYLEPAGALDADAVREALLAVLAAHPQLRLRLDAEGGRLTGQDATGSGAAGGQDPLVEGEFTDEAGFAAAVASTGRTLDARLGIQVRALLARDRRQAGRRADRLALVVHELAVDAASWRTLLDDVAAALGTAADGTPARPRRAPDGLAGWVAGLRELARDPDEVRHWTSVADRRSRAAAGRRPAPAARPTAGPAPADARDAGPGAVRHTGFVLEEDVTGRITRDLAQRLALTAGQVLTGVFALALARWQGTDEVSLDVRSDPRAGHEELRQHVGRLTDPHPVHLTLEPGLDPLGQLAAAAGPLAAGAGRAAGGAGFGACREWSPDPLLRDALRSLAPAPVCLTLHGPGELLPGSARPVPGGARSRSPHPVQARVQVAGGRLHLGLDWVPDHAEGLTDTTVAALADLLRELLLGLAEAADAPIPSAFRATPQQLALFTGGDARPGTGRHVEQLVWVWHGPLDVERFTAAWQSVFDCEAVLRTAFTGGPEPQLMVHSRVTPEITRRIHRADDWSPLLERDRLRGFDLRCPGALRLTLLEAERTRPADPPSPTRIVLTYHRALIDTWSAHLLLREFYRAYLAGGTLPGGERRPDLRDYTAWLAAQDREFARDFAARTAPPGEAASRPGRPAGTTGLTGVGRARLRLDPEETGRLAQWAGRWGAAESSVLQAVWAMLIYRASGAPGPAPVSFAVTVPGRGIPLDGVARMPGPLRNALPMCVEVDPADTVPGLLRQLRDRALDMAAYEWVSGDWTHPPGRCGPGAAGAGTVIVFEDPPHPVEGLHGELAAHGIRVEFSGTVPARSVLPIGLLAHHDDAGGLVFTTVHDRALLDEEAAAELLVQSAMLLQELPVWADEFTTVAEVLKLLEGRAVPRMADASRAGRDDPLRTLRAAAVEEAGTICLIPPPGTPATCYDLLPPAHPGPQELLVLTTGADAARSALASRATGRSLLLGGFSGAGALACALARRIAADGGDPPQVVVAGAGADEGERIRALARALGDAAVPGA